VPELFLSLFSVGPDEAGAALALQIIAAAMIMRGFTGTPDLLFLVTGRAHFEISALVVSQLMLVAALLLAPATPQGVAMAIALGQGARVVITALLMRLASSGRRHQPADTPPPPDN
jgi:O-antigen/teichoic acid export membrane protein